MVTLVTWHMCGIAQPQTQVSIEIFFTFLSTVFFLGGHGSYEEVTAECCCNHTIDHILLRGIYHLGCFDCFPIADCYEYNVLLNINPWNTIKAGTSTHVEPIAYAGVVVVDVAYGV